MLPQKKLAYPKRKTHLPISFWRWVSKTVGLILWN